MNLTLSLKITLQTALSCLGFTWVNVKKPAQNSVKPLFNDGSAQCFLNSPVKFILFVYSGTLQTDLLRACKNPINIRNSERCNFRIFFFSFFFGHVVWISGLYG